MKFIFTADLHLDSAFVGQDSVLKNRGLITVFESIVAFAKKENISAIVIGGDLFDSPTPTPETVGLLKDIIEKNSDISFYAVAGNHDPLSKTAFYKDAPKNMFVFSDNVESVCLGDTKLYGVSVKDADDNRDIWRGVTVEDGSILVCHGTLGGTGGFYISREAVENTGASLLLMGHIHKSEEYLFSGPRALYCGVPAGRGFDECGEKGFYVVDTDTKEILFHKTNAKVYKEYFVDISGCGDQTQVLLRLNSVSVGANETARAVLTGQFSGEFIIECSVLNSYAPQFVEIKDKTMISDDIMENADKSTLEGEFIRILTEKLKTADESQKQMIFDAIKEGVCALRCNK